MKRFLAFLFAATLLFTSQVTPSMAADLEAFDLNKASVEQLTAIPSSGISKDMAEAIIKASKDKPFTLPEDLLKVPGLDNKILEAINPQEQDGSLWYDPDAEMTLAPSKC